MYKGYRIEALPTFAMVKILPQKSGDIPHSLKGLYTTKRDAELAIDRYLATLGKKKGKTNGEKGSEPTS